MRPTAISYRGLLSKARLLLPWLLIAGLFFYQLAFLYYSPSLINSPALGDFGSFIASGLAAKAGDNPYGIHPLTSQAKYQGEVEFFPNMNPPVSVLIFEWLAIFDPAITLRIWTFLQILFYLAGVIVLYLSYHPTPIWFAWAFVLAGFWDTLALGQIYTLLFVILVAAWLSISSDRMLVAGILIGILVAIKPNLLLWPALLFLAGFRRPAIWAFLTAMVLSILPIFRYGSQVYQQWFEAITQASWKGMPHYLSLSGTTIRLGIPWLGYLLALLLIIILAVWIWRRQPNIILTSTIALVASILASPLATPRFTLLLVPVLYMHYRDTWMRLPTLVFLIPTSLIIFLGFLSPGMRLVVGLPYTLALLILLWRTLTNSTSQAAIPTDSLG